MAEIHAETHDEAIALIAAGRLRVTLKGVVSMSSTETEAWITGEDRKWWVAHWPEIGQRAGRWMCEVHGEQPQERICQCIAAVQLVTGGT